MNYKSAKEEKNLRLTIRTRNINHSLKGKKEVSEDTQNRQLIQRFILEVTSRMNDEEKILALLNDKFEGTKYDKYRPFFKQWVQHRLKDKKLEHDEER